MIIHPSVPTPHSDHLKEVRPMFRPRLHHAMPAPPHVRKAFMHVEFDDNDWSTLLAVFGDADSAAAAASIILDAPPERQILAAQTIQIINMIQLMINTINKEDA